MSPEINDIGYGSHGHVRKSPQSWLMRIEPQRVEPPVCSDYEKQLRVVVAAGRLVAGADTKAHAALHVDLLYRGIVWRLFDADGYDAKLAEHVALLRAR